MNIILSCDMPHSGSVTILAFWVVHSEILGCWVLEGEVSCCQMILCVVCLPIWLCGMRSVPGQTVDILLQKCWLLLFPIYRIYIYLSGFFLWWLGPSLHVCQIWVFSCLGKKRRLIFSFLVCILWCRALEWPDFLHLSIFWSASVSAVGRLL